MNTDIIFKICFVVMAAAFTFSVIRIITWLHLFRSFAIAKVDRNINLTLEQWLAVLSVAYFVCYFMFL